MSAPPRHRVSVPAEGVMRLDIPLALRSPERINCYLLESPDGQLLVDTGMRGSEDALDAALAEVEAQVSRVLITHGHIDHWGLAIRFAASVLAHPGSRSQLDFARGDAPPRGPLAGGAADGADIVRVFSRYRRLVDGVPDIDPLEDGDTVAGWRVVWTPGHAPGHICLHRESDGILLAGDHLLPGFTPNIQPSEDRVDSLADFLGSLERVAGLDVRLVLPGHGEPFTDAARRAAELHDHHEERLQRLEALLEEGPLPLGDLTTGIFSNLRSSEDQMLADMETFAHLEHLRLRRRARRLDHDRWAA